MLTHTLAGARGGGVNVARALVAQSVVAGWVVAAISVFPIHVRPDGLRGYNFYGVYRTIRWHDIKWVGRVSVLGAAYLVTNDGTGQVWVPLYLPDMAGFIRAVLACVGDGHTLAVALREHRADLYPGDEPSTHLA